MYSLANNHFSSWSDKTICRLAKATPDNVKYQAESTSRGLSCGGGTTQENSTPSQKVESAMAGIDIENDPNVDFFKPPLSPKSTNQLFGRTWKIADYNNDGISDVLYIGAMIADNAADGGSEDTGDICGTDACWGFKPLPSLYLGDEKGQLADSPQLIIDSRKESGMSGGRQLLVADFNGDNTLDFYVADHGIGTHNGVRDSYFLSQPNDTWAESSETHLSHSNFKVFDHGGATGDIDNDGDMDVVITELNYQKNGTSFWCLMNDGTGFLGKRKCGGAFAFGLELADMDGDGDLDALVGAHEFDKNKVTGIIWNNGKGFFSKKTALPQYKKKWGVIPEVSASDLDNDGDLDIVYSRAGELYVGTAIQIIENLGNKKFKDHGIFPLVEAPDNFKAFSEGNGWNDFIESISFRDFDDDGDNDMYLTSGTPKTNGTIIINNGNFKFDILSPSESSLDFEDGSQKKILINAKDIYVGVEPHEGQVEDSAQVIKVDYKISESQTIVVFSSKPLLSKSRNETLISMVAVIYDENLDKNHTVEFVFSYSKYPGTDRIIAEEIELSVVKSANTDLFGKSWWWIGDDVENTFPYDFLLNVLEEDQKESLVSTAKKLLELSILYFGSELDEDMKYSLIKLNL